MDCHLSAGWVGILLGGLGVNNSVHVTYAMMAMISFAMSMEWISDDDKTVSMISEIDNCPHHFRLCFGSFWLCTEFVVDDIADIVPGTQGIAAMLMSCVSKTC